MASEAVNDVQDPKVNSKDITSSANNKTENANLLNDYSVSLPSPINILQSIQSVFNEFNYPVDVTSLYSRASKFYADVIRLPDVNQRMAVLSSVKIPFVDMNEDLRKHLLSANTKEQAVIVNGLFGGVSDMEHSQFYKSGVPHTVTTVVDNKQRQELKNKLLDYKTKILSFKNELSKVDEESGKAFKEGYSALLSTNNALKTINLKAKTDINQQQLRNAYIEYRKNQINANKYADAIVGLIDKSLAILDKKDITNKDVKELNKTLKDIDKNHPIFSEYLNNTFSKAGDVSHMGAASGLYLQAAEHLKNNPTLVNEAVKGIYEMDSDGNIIRTDSPVHIPVDAVQMAIGNQPLISELLNKTNKKAFKDALTQLANQMPKTYNALYDRWFHGEDAPFDNPKIDNTIKSYFKANNDLVFSYYVEKLRPDGTYEPGIYKDVLAAVKDPSSFKMSEEAMASFKAIKEHTPDPYLFVKSSLLLGNVGEKEQNILKNYHPDTLVSDLFENVAKTAGYSLLYLFGEWSVPKAFKDYVRYEQPLAMVKYKGLPKDMMSIAQGVGFIGGAVAQMGLTMGASGFLRMLNLASFSARVGSLMSRVSNLDTMTKFLSAHKIAASFNFGKYLDLASLSSKGVNLGRFEFLSGLGRGSAKVLSYVTPMEETLTYISRYGFRGNASEIINTFVKYDLIPTMAVINEAHMERSFVRHEMQDRIKVLEDTKGIYGNLTNHLSIDPENASYLTAIAEGRANDMVDDAGFTAFLLNLGVISAFNRVTHIGFMRRVMEGKGSFSAAFVRKGVKGSKLSVGALKPQLFKTMAWGLGKSFTMNVFEGLQENFQDIADDYAKYASIHMEPRNLNNRNGKISAAIQESAKSLNGQEFNPMGYLTDTESGAFQTFWTTLVSGMLVNGIVGLPAFGMRYNRFVKKVKAFNESIARQERKLSELEKVEDLKGFKVKAVFTPGLDPNKLMKGRVKVEAIQDATADYPAMDDVEKIMKANPLESDYEDYMWIMDNLDYMSRRALANRNIEMANLLKEESDKDAPQEDRLYHFRKLLQLWYYHTALLGEETAEKFADKMTNHLLKQVNIDPEMIRRYNEGAEVDKETMRKIDHLNNSARESLKLLSDEFRYRASTMTKDPEEIYDSLVKQFKDNEEVSRYLRLARKGISRSNFIVRMSDDMKKNMLLSLLQIDKKTGIDESNIENVLAFLRSQKGNIIEGKFKEEDLNTSTLSDKEKGLVLLWLNLFNTNRSARLLLSTAARDNTEKGQEQSQKNEEYKARKVSKDKANAQKISDELFSSMMEALQSIREEYADKIETYRKDYREVEERNKADILYRLLMNVKYVQSNIAERLKEVRNTQVQNIELFRDKDTDKSFTLFDMLSSSDSQQVLKKIYSYLRDQYDGSVIASDPEIKEKIDKIAQIIQEEDSYVTNKNMKTLKPEAVNALHGEIKELLSVLQDKIQNLSQAAVEEKDLQEIYKSLYWMSLSTEGLSDAFMGTLSKNILEKIETLEEGRELMEKINKYIKAKQIIEEAEENIKDISGDEESKPLVRYYVLNLLYQYSAFIGRDLVKENPAVEMLIDHKWVEEVKDSQEQRKIEDSSYKLLELLVSRAKTSAAYTETKTQLDDLIKDNKEAATRKDLEKKIEELDGLLYAVDVQMEGLLLEILDSYQKVRPNEASKIYEELSTKALMGIGAHLSSSLSVLEDVYLNDIYAFFKQLKGLKSEEKAALMYAISGNRYEASNREVLRDLQSLVADETQKKLLDVFDNKAEEIKSELLVNQYDKEMRDILADGDIFDYIYEKAKQDAVLVNPLFETAFPFDALDKMAAMLDEISGRQRTEEEMLEGAYLTTEHLPQLSEEEREKAIQEIKDTLSELQAAYDDLKTTTRLLDKVYLYSIRDRIMPLLHNIFEKYPSFYSSRMAMVVSLLKKHDVLMYMFQQLESMSDDYIKSNSKTLQTMFSQSLLDFIDLFNKATTQVIHAPNAGPTSGSDLPEDVKEEFKNVLEIVVRHINVMVDRITDGKIRDIANIDDGNRRVLLDGVMSHYDKNVKDSHKAGMKHIGKNFMEYLKRLPEDKKKEFEDMSDEEKIREIAAFGMKLGLSLISTRDLEQLPDHLNNLDWKDNIFIGGILYAYAMYHGSEKAKKRKSEPTEASIPNVRLLKDVSFIQEASYESRIQDMVSLVKAKEDKKAYISLLSDIIPLTSEKGISKQVFRSVGEVREKMKGLIEYLVYATYVANDGKGLSYAERSKIYRAIYELGMNVWRVNELEADKRKDHLFLLEDLMLATYVFVKNTTEEDIRKDGKTARNNVRFLFDMAIYSSNEVSPTELDMTDAVVGALRYVGLLHAAVPEASAAKDAELLTVLGDIVGSINYHAFGDSNEELMSRFYNNTAALQLWNNHRDSKVNEEAWKAGVDMLEVLSKHQLNTIKDHSIMEGIKVNYKTLHNFLLEDTNRGNKMIGDLLETTKDNIIKLGNSKDINAIFEATDYIIKVFNFSDKDKSNNRLIMNDDLRQRVLNVLNATKAVVGEVEDSSYVDKKDQHMKDLDRLVQKYDKLASRPETKQKTSKGEKPKGSPVPSASNISNVNVPPANIPPIEGNKEPSNQIKTPTAPPSNNIKQMIDLLHKKLININKKNAVVFMDAVINTLNKSVKDDAIKLQFLSLVMQYVDESDRNKRVVIFKDILKFINKSIDKSNARSKIMLREDINTFASVFNKC